MTLSLANLHWRRQLNHQRCRSKTTTLRPSSDFILKFRQPQLIDVRCMLWLSIFYFLFLPPTLIVQFFGPSCATPGSRSVIIRSTSAQNHCPRYLGNTQPGSGAYMTHRDQIAFCASCQSPRVLISTAALWGQRLINLDRHFVCFGEGDQMFHVCRGAVAQDQTFGHAPKQCTC